MGRSLIAGLPRVAAAEETVPVGTTAPQSLEVPPVAPGSLPVLGYVG